MKDSSGRLGSYPDFILVSFAMRSAGRAETTVGGVQMHKKLACCDIGKSCDSVTESVQVHTIDTSGHLLLERVVSCVIFPENGLLGGKNTSEM